jgi:hypothetical protein
MGLSVVVFIQLVITLLPYRFHEAANQLFCLHQQTRRVLVEVLLARNLGFQLSVLLHRPPSHLIQNRKPANRKDLARCGQHRLLPLLHVGLSSARWLRSKPRKLEATKRHPVGHPELRSPWPTYFVTYPASLSCDSPPALLDKLVPRRSSSNPFLARWGEARGAPGSTARHRPEGPCPGGSRPPGQKRAGSAARARCTALSYGPGPAKNKKQGSFWCSQVAEVKVKGGLKRLHGLI